MHRIQVRVAAVAALFLLIGITVACQPSGPELPDDELPADPDLPEAVVDLPSPPPASAFEFHEHNDDGTLRVEGVIGNRDRYLEEEVEVRGTVGEILGYQCNPSVDTCPRAHLFIRDDIDEDLDLMIVGYDDAFVRKAGLRQGEEFLFRGTYLQMSDGFVSTETGLIELIAVDDHEI